MTAIRSKLSLAAAALSALLATAGAAAAEDAMATANVNMRAGPDTTYPVITTIPYRASVDIVGCMEGWGWCDVIWYGARGWVSSDYLASQDRYYAPAPTRDYRWHAGVPVIQFSVTSYWNDHYRSRSWYGDRDRWAHNDGGRNDGDRDRSRRRDRDRDSSRGHSSDERGGRGERRRR